MNTLRVEILESRIAPATFLVNPRTLEVTDASSGASAQDSVPEDFARTFADVDAAFLMASGDKLIFDSNANERADLGETVLVSVVSGQAMIFMTDRDANGLFDPFEITG